MGRYYDSTDLNNRRAFGNYAEFNMKLRAGLFKTQSCSGFLNLDLNNLTNRKYEYPWQFMNTGFNFLAKLELKNLAHWVNKPGMRSPQGEAAWCCSMTYKSSISISCALLIFFLLLPTTALASPCSPIAVTDFRGKVLVFSQPVSRIVCLIESALSGIYMLREGHRIVGISTNVYQEPLFKYYAALDRRIRNKELPSPGNWDFISLEGVVALKPDVVILWSQQTEVIAALEERGIPVFGVFINTRGDIEREIMALGAMTGALDRAQELVHFTQDELRRFSGRVADIPVSQRPTVYFMWAQSTLETSGGSSMVNDLISLAGGRNVCQLLDQEHLVVKLEQVLGWNPDIIVMWSNPRLSPQDIMADEQWRLLKAARHRRVYQLPEVFLCDLWTLKYVFTVNLLATWLHPERFADIDLIAEKQRLFLELYGVSFGDF